MILGDVAEYLGQSSPMSPHCTDSIGLIVRKSESGREVGIYCDRA